jgi:hypothetical protein
MPIQPRAFREVGKDNPHCIVLRKKRSAWYKVIHNFTTQGEDIHLVREDIEKYVVCGLADTFLIGVFALTCGRGPVRDAL